MRKVNAAEAADKAIREFQEYQEAVEYAKAKLLKEIEVRDDGLPLSYLIGVSTAARSRSCAAAIVLKMKGAARTLEICEYHLKPPLKDAALGLQKVHAAYAKSFLSMASCLHTVAKI